MTVMATNGMRSGVVRELRAVVVKRRVRTMRRMRKRIVG